MIAVFVCLLFGVSTCVELSYIQVVYPQLTVREHGGTRFSLFIRAEKSSSNSEAWVTGCICWFSPG